MVGVSDLYAGDVLHRETIVHEISLCAADTAICGGFQWYIERAVSDIARAGDGSSQQPPRTASLGRCSKFVLEEKAVAVVEEPEPTPKPVEFPPFDTQAHGLTRFGTT